jgi:hypothetical protein
MRAFTQVKFVTLQLEDLNPLLHDMQLEGKNIVDVKVLGHALSGATQFQIIYHLIDERAVSIEEDQNESTEESIEEVGTDISSE